MSERVKPDVVDSVLPEDAFYLSTILRVIDEELAVWQDDETKSGVQSRYVLHALRARFGEAADE